jgi:vitamin B12 transporter
MKKYQLLIALLCAVISFAHAESEISLDEVIVTATRLEQPLNQTLSSTSVITREDIKNSQVADVASILSSVAGVEISQAGGTGKASSLYLRGSEATQVLVLLDGVRINTATFGTTSIEHLMLDQIERIEIVRGNVSSLYGSEAIGGVIQIFTKQGQGEPVFNFSAGAGTHGTQRMAAGFAGSREKTDFSLQLSKYTTEGISAIDQNINTSANPDKDGYQNTSLSANIRHSINSDHSLTFGIFNSLGHNQYDSAFGPASDVNTNETRLGKLSITSDNRLNETWQSKLQLAKGTDSYRDFTNGEPTAYFGNTSSLFQTDNLQLIWSNQLTLGDKKKLLLGVEHLDQRVTSDMQPGYDQTERKVNSLFVGYTGRYVAHQIQANLRQDHNSQFGTANTGLIGYGYIFTETWRATTSYSTAFRAPTFNDLYWPGAGASNPALKPEQSRNTEAGLRYAKEKRNIDAVYFDNQTHNLISLDSNWTPQNINQARISGIELSYAEQFSDTGLKVSAVSQNARDLTTDTMLQRRANQYGNLSVTQKFGAMQLGAQWQYSAARRDNTKTLDSYHVFNLTAAYAFNKQTKLTLRADNITDQNNSTVYGYTPLGRTFFINLSYQ